MAGHHLFIPQVDESHCQKLPNSFQLANVAYLEEIAKSEMVNSRLECRGETDSGKDSGTATLERPSSDLNTKNLISVVLKSSRDWRE